MTSNKQGKATQAIHGRTESLYRSAVYPVFHSTTFAVAKSDDYGRYYGGEEDLYIYARQGNPTVRNVEEKLAVLENGEDAVLFASGMAAITSTVLAFVSGGDTLVASSRLYGTAYHFLNTHAARFGVNVHFLPEDDLYRLDALIPQAKAVYFETPINPTSDCIAIPRVVAAARKIGAVTIMDNTFASPINQNPLDWGVDVVIHSATKYIGGHSDVTAGAAITSEALGRQIRANMKTFGGNLNAHEASLLDRSLKTLSLRVERHNQNALALARFFQREAKVRGVYYPGLPESPYYAIAAEQMRGFGGMLCIELGNLPAAKRFCDALQVVLNATSLGSVESLVSIPVLTSHVGLNEDELQAARVTPGMVRISAGLEDVDDLIQDFRHALETV